MCNRKSKVQNTLCMKSESKVLKLKFVVNCLSKNFYDISGSHGGKHQSYSFLRCDNFFSALITTKCTTLCFTAEL